ncbi:membrane-spanning 4-domains subfamily A member 4A-like isoform 2-T2 [Discoglossus pictus]
MATPMNAPINGANAPFMVPMQWNYPPAGPTMTPVNTNSPQTPPFYQMFLKGHPKALGTTQILLAFMSVALGTVLIYVNSGIVTISVYSGVYYWAAVFYIISGSLSIAAENKQSRSLIRGSLAMNIISSIISLAALTLFCIDVPYLYYNYVSCSSGDYDCMYFVDILLVVRWTALSFSIIGSLLQFCVTVALSSFGCKALKEKSTVPPQVFVIQNDYNTPGISSTSQMAPGGPSQYPGPQSNVSQEAANFRNPMISAAQPQMTGNPMLPQNNYRAGDTNPSSVYPSYNLPRY